MTDDRHKRDDELTDEELDEQEAAGLPDREAMSILSPPLIYDPLEPLPPESV